MQRAEQQGSRYIYCQVSAAGKKLNEIFLGDINCLLKYIAVAFQFPLNLGCLLNKVPHSWNCSYIFVVNKDILKQYWKSPKGRMVMIL